MPLVKVQSAGTENVGGGNRNIAFNGAMQISQRSTSVTGIGASTGYFTVDRFALNVGNTAGRLTMSQESITDLSGFAKAIKLDCTTADTSIASNERLIFVQRFEGQDLQQIKKGTSDAEIITVSFYVKGNANATYTLELADEDNSRFVAQEFSVTSSWTRVTKTFVADTTGKFDNDNAHSMSLNIWLHAGSDFTGGTFTSNTVHTTANQRVGDNQTSFFDSTDRTFFITGLQMEIGSQATPFEYRSTGQEFLLCSRYFYKPIKSGNNSAMITSTNDVYRRMYVFYPTQMRASPTVSVLWSNSATSAGENNQHYSYHYVHVGSTTATAYIDTHQYDAEL